MTDETTYREVKPNLQEDKDAVLICQATLVTENDKDSKSGSSQGKEESNNPVKASEDTKAKSSTSNADESKPDDDSKDNIEPPTDENSVEERRKPVTDSLERKSDSKPDYESKVISTDASNVQPSKDKLDLDGKPIMIDEKSSKSIGDALEVMSSNNPPVPKRGCELLDLDGNVFSESVGKNDLQSNDEKRCQVELPKTSPVEPKLSSPITAVPTVPTLETPREDNVTHESNDKNSPNGKVAAVEEVESQGKKSSNTVNLLQGDGDIKTPVVGIDDKNASAKSVGPSSSKEDPQDQHIIDPATFHQRFCRQIKKKSMPNTNKTQTAKMPPTENMSSDSRKTSMMGMLDQMPSKDMVGGMMDRMMDRMNSSRMGMGRISPNSRFHAMGMDGGMFNSYNPMMDMMRGDFGGDPMMRPGGGKSPGNLQELREMMGRDMNTDLKGSDMFNYKGSRNAPDFNLDGSKGMSSGPEGMVGELFNRLGRKDSPGADNAMKDDASSVDPEKKSQGYDKKDSYNDISFSPLDKLDRGLMARMMASYQDNNDPSRNPMSGSGPMPRMLPLSHNANKRNMYDYTYSPRSSNPKKSFLERHRMMDLEMEGQLKEAMANFGRFSRKYSGSGGMMGGDASMFGDVNKTHTEESKSSSKGRKKYMKEKSKAKKAKSKTKKESQKKANKSAKLKAKQNDDPRKPKRPFSAYNIFFQLEREAILARTKAGRDTLKDKIEKEYLAKVKSGEVEDEDTPLGPPPPHNPAIHEPLDPNTPERYKDLRLEKFWYRAGCKTKRRHRKSEGASVPFLELTKMISRRWALIQELEPSIRTYCTRLAQQELKHYKEELSKWKAIVKEEIEAGHSDDSVSFSSDSDVEEGEEAKLPKRKRPRQVAGMESMSEMEIGSQTPTAMRDAMFDPQFSSRFTDLSRMSGMFANSTPMDMYANRMGAACGGNHGLPPPPLFGEDNGPDSMAAMAEAKQRYGIGSMNMGNGGVMGDRAAALADARRRMQLDMQSMGQSGQMGDFPRGMSQMMNDNMFPGGMSDGPSRFSYMQREMMMNQNRFPPSTGGDDMMRSMRNRFMNRFDNADSMPQNGKDFDQEVERFLSCLGREIKEKQRQSGDIGDREMGMGSSYDRNAMMNRMMMDQMRDRTYGGGNMPSLSDNSNFRQQTMRNNNVLDNDNPQLPEFRDSQGRSKGL